MSEILVLRKAFQITLKADDAAGEFSGYAATYARDSEGDRIEPGAFAQSIKDRKGKIPIFLNHDRTQWAGVSTELSEDHKGLYMTARLFPDTSAGRDAYGLLKNATAADFPVGLSIGFLTKDWDFEQSTQTRILKTIELWETSITPFPANRLARVDDVKALRNFERLTRDVCKCSAADAKRLLAMLPLDLSGDPEGNPLTSARDVRNEELASLRESVRQLKETTFS